MFGPGHKVLFAIITYLSLHSMNAVADAPILPSEQGVVPVMLASTLTALKMANAANLQSTPGIESTYAYSAFLKGAKTHEAKITVSRGGVRGRDKYEIHGKAKAVGIFGFLSHFKSRFLALGHLVNNRPVPDTFELDKQSKKSTRVVRIKGDVLRVTRNGVVRPPKATLASIDVLSAFFMMGACADTKDFHTGRHGYLMTLLSSGADGRGMRCDYHLIDDDKDEYEGTVWLGERNGFVIPLRFEFEGAQSGLILLDPA